MDPCPKIWFETPAQIVGSGLGIFTIAAALLALAAMC